MTIMLKLLRASCLLLVPAMVVPIACAQLCQNLRNPKLILADFNLSKSQEAVPGGTSFIFWPGTASEPVALLSVTHDAEHDLFASGTIKNRDSSSISAYRIGWLVFPSSAGEIKFAQGPLVQLKNPITSSEVSTIGPQGATPALLSSAPSLIVFFVAEAQFSDGSRWKASVSEIQSKYR
jgi:hypothetical protein